MQDDDDAGDLAIASSRRTECDDGLAAKEQELLGLALRQAHAPAVAGGGDDDPTWSAAVLLSRASLSGRGAHSTTC